MTVPAQLDLYAPITKRERDPKTGHLYVYGKITGSDLDHDQQRMDPQWLKAAVPDWFKSAGNLRESHDPKRAIGKAVELEEKADGWYIGAKVVDRDAAEKVEEDVLTGFSIGIKNYQLDRSNKADAPNGLVVSGRICETSLVDAPCLGSAKITDHWRLPLAKSDAAGELQPIEEPELIRTDGESDTDTFGLLPELYDRLATPVKDALAALAAGGAQIAAELGKSDDSDDSPTPVVVNVIVKAADPDLAKGYSEADRKRMADTHQALPDGSFPIKTKADLRRAIKAVGRGGADHDEIRAHIAKRAAALGLEAMVPDNWNADGSLKDAQKADAATIEKAEQVLRDVRALVPELAKADATDGEFGLNEQPDIDGATAAIAAIAALIISEAESLAQGNFNELCDIQLLCSAAESLRWFTVREANENNGDDADMGLADEAELLKAAAPKAKNGGKLAPPFGKKKDADAEDDSDDDAADGDDTEDDEDDDEDDTSKKPAAKKKAAAKADAGELLTKADADAAIKAAVDEALAALAVPETSPAKAPETVTKADLAEMVKAAVAEATSAAQERTDALAADLAKAEEQLSTQADELVKTNTAMQAIRDTPLPGGPVLTRSNAQAASAVQSDSDRMRAEANDLIEKAERFASNPTLSQGYRARARGLLEKAV
jgi:hypothetical protein